MPAMRDPYVRWTTEQITDKLVADGCRCVATATCDRVPPPPISTSSSEVEGEPWSLVAKHRCAECGVTVHEVADPDYEMPPDVDR